MPVTCAPVWQAKKSPRRQLSQEKQCQACHPTPTRWPGCHRSGTSLPTASITPTTSCPGTRGKVMPGQRPSLVKTSLWQTPQAWTLIRTDPGPGSGIGRSTSSRGPPARETWATRIVALRMFISVFCGSWMACMRVPRGANGGRGSAVIAPPVVRLRSLLLLLRDRDLFGVAGVQDHCQEAGPGLATRIPGHPVHRSRRLVERIPGLVGLDRLVVEGVLVFAFQDVAEHRAGMVMR